MSMASRLSSQLQLKNMEENHEEEEEVVKPHQQEKQVVEEDEQPVKCITLYKRGGGRTGNNKVYGLSGKGQWRQEQRLRASRMEHHLGIHCSLEDLIQEQLSRFDGHYSRALGQRRRLKDMSQILMPTKCRLPVELACLSWYGNWRPSSILSLVQSFSRTPKSSSSSSGITASTPLSRSERVLSDLIKQTRTEELILDEEMAEIQATCILHLPFKKASMKTSSVASDLACVYSEFKKIDRVYNQAQKLRYRTLELVVKKLLNQSQAAEFLVAFAGIQEMVHEFAVCRNRQKKGPISVTIKSNNGMQQLIDSYLSSGR